MNSLVDRLVEQAMDYAAEQYGPQRRGEKVWYPNVLEKKLAELVLAEVDDVIDGLYHSLPLEKAVVLLTLDEMIKDRFYKPDNL